MSSTLALGDARDGWSLGRALGVVLPVHGLLARAQRGITMILN